jgi:hypothetical protein
MEEYPLDEWDLMPSTLRPVSAEAALEYAGDIQYVNTTEVKRALDEEIAAWTASMEEEDESWRKLFSPLGWAAIATAILVGVILIAFSLISAVQFG